MDRETTHAHVGGAVIILAIDPGPKESAYVTYADGLIIQHDYLPNEDLVKKMILSEQRGRYALVIEWIEGYGLTVGRETFDTCRWVGRFEQAAGGAHLLGRKAIKSHLCNTTQAKDRDIRAALIDRFGEPGTKKAPGPTYGIVGDEWAALAVAVTWADTHKEAP
jgi:hypothetical protein